ncbi:MAG: Threonine synthase [Candidatus Methanofastidiosum methylothiophilum]|uniref:Threonine synthase n=1 Tax=Candidatus Methanofastidiosum methylothiophilum TaxID=1705564 RepID=A0A150IXD3_9EURY|nr:MAG: Threonine synthase [Candidatus Methanofastidiosum methylthiophilus]KYC46980.1 MAG: Threonine synthase [Candidatus Methanofastidiosum methylthiophilus]KYC49633.1 MAG: Threonine synthase [Candidatus Methanofastidiosum methylthiophilus]
MSNYLDFIKNERARDYSNKKVSTDFVSQDVAKKVRSIYSEMQEYQKTPLVSLENLSKKLGVGKIWVKDESYRFGLNSFKSLGGIYAIYRTLEEMAGRDISIAEIFSPYFKKTVGELTFSAATDGNHGLGVAWASMKLGQKAVIYLPKGTVPQRIEAIKNTGAKAVVIDGNYDDAVEKMARDGEKEGWQVISDTAWEGYQDIPTWIMQGYTVLFHEAVEQIKQSGGDKPTHIILQAGVGSFSASGVGYFNSIYGKERPISIIVEPDNAACFYESIQINDGKPHRAKGDLSTIMAGLSCGVPNPIAWDIHFDYSDVFVSCRDELSALSMRVLGNPLKGDKKVISGESGAIGLGVLMHIKNELEIGKDSEVLLISTEGDTDPKGYLDVVWGGKFPSELPIM